MRELEKEGINWFSSKATEYSMWDIYKEETVYFVSKYKEINYSSLSYAQKCYGIRGTEDKEDCRKDFPNGIKVFTVKNNNMEDGF